MNLLLNNYDDVTLLQIHINDYPYNTTWGETRRTFYSVTGTPTAWFDGTVSVLGGYAGVYDDYVQAYENRKAVACDLNIRIGGELISGNTYRIAAEVCLEDPGSTKNMFIHIAQVLDYWPITPTAPYSRHGFKQAVASESVHLTAGNCTTFETEMDFDADSMNNEDDIKIIVWAQQNLTSGPADVYQAAEMGWPFTPPYFLCPGDLDRNGFRDFTDYLVFTDAYPSAVGDPNYHEGADIDHNDLVDFTDFLLLADVYGVDCP